MKTTSLTISSLCLVTIIAFVYFAQPIYAKANSDSLDYVTTTMSSQEVAALFTGAEAFLPAAIVIIGFIVLMYCTLRNIDTPIDFNGQQSFIDKCQSLGQFMIDNISDDVKDFFYSVYIYAQNNNLTSISGITAFVMLHAQQFFGSIARWIGGSLLYGISSNGAALLNQFVSNPLLTYNSYDYVSDFSSLFDSYSGYSYSDHFGYFSGWRSGSYQFVNNWGSFLSTTVILLSPNGIGKYEKSGDSFILSSNHFQVYYFNYNDSYYADAPNLRSYSHAVTYGAFSRLSFSQGQGFSIDRDLVSFILSKLPCNVYFVSSLDTSISISDAQPFIISNPDDLLNPASDNVYSPSLDQVDIDIFGTYADIASAAAAAAASGAVVTALDKIQAYVGDIGLTLESAIPQDVVVDNAGNYHFPNLDGIWKYPRYFFDTLKGWGAFVGGCLNAVTVGEGGLSWLFYGGFIILVCGGVVGKIILG